jgi:S-adenosylmethionine hydrolase
MMSIITLLTDFGLSESFIGVMKGVIWTIAPDVQIADLTHDIRPQNVLEAAFVIAEAAPYFPAGTVHVCVVDPGVGTARRPMAACIGGQYFVGPDNGLFSLVIENNKIHSTPPIFIELNQRRFWLPQPSNSFHGRDIFAPVSAHLAKGVLLVELGDRFDDPVMVSAPKPVKTENGWQGKVIRVDHFGNLVTNFSCEQLEAGAGVSLRVGKHTITDFVTTFGNRPACSLIFMIDSDGHLAISVVNGSAADRLGIGVEEPVLLSFSLEGQP